MGIFSKIKDSIFGKDEKVRPEDRPTIPAGWEGAPEGATEVAPGTKVDVEQRLIEISNSKGNPDLNWRTSIVDLMKLLGLDSDLQNRKELAQELGYSGELNGSAEMNIWLHRQVMQKLEENGGQVPASLKG